MVEIVADETDVLPRNRDEESFSRSFAGTWKGQLLLGPFSGATSHVEVGEHV